MLRCTWRRCDGLRGTAVVSFNPARATLRMVERDAKACHQCRADDRNKKPGHPQWPGHVRTDCLSLPPQLSALSGNILFIVGTFAFFTVFHRAHLCNLDWLLLAAQCWRVWWRTIFGKRARIAPAWPNHRHRQRRHSNLALWDPARSRMPMQGWLPKKPEMTGRAWLRLSDLCSARAVTGCCGRKTAAGSPDRCHRRY